MNTSIFVQNIKKYCEQKGVKPTPACRDAGVSGSFISNIERGAMPSIDKVQMLAEYLGVTTSDLLGEEKPAGEEASGLSEEMMEIIALYDKASPELQAAALGMLRAAEAARSIPGAEKGGQ